MLQDVSAINGNNLSVQILVCCTEQNTAAHITVITRALCEHLAFEVLFRDLIFLVVTALACSHLGWVDAWSNAVDADLEAVIADLEGEKFGQLDDGGLGGVVREVMLSGLDNARDRAYVDDSARVAVLMLRSGLQKREEGHRHEVALRDYSQLAVNQIICRGLESNWERRAIGAVGIDPILEGGFLIVKQVRLHLVRRLSLGLECLAIDPGIVDQNANTFLLLLDLLVHACNILL